MLDELATWHSVRALAVTKMDDDGEVSIGRAVKIQGQRGKACLENGTYTRNSTNSTIQVSKIMAAPLAPVADATTEPPLGTETEHEQHAILPEHQVEKRPRPSAGQLGIYRAEHAQHRRRWHRQEERLSR
jgi:hypothetical protein